MLLPTPVPGADWKEHSNNLYVTCQSFVTSHGSADLGRRWVVATPLDSIGLVVLSIFLVVFDGGETMFLSKRRVQDIHMTSTPFSNLIFVAKSVQTD